MEDSGVYLGEGDRDASVQLNVIGQLCKLVLLLLKCLQQTVDLLLGKHHSAVVLKPSEQAGCVSLFFSPLSSLAPQWISPAGASSRSADKLWRPETEGWSCPPAAAAARSASRARERPPRSAPSPPADTGSHGGLQSRLARRIVHSLPCQAPGERDIEERTVMYVN